MNYETVLMNQILRANTPKILKSLQDSKPIMMSSEHGLINEPIKLMVTAEEKVLYDEEIDGFVFTIQIRDENKNHLSHRAIAERRPLNLSRASSLKELDANFEQAAAYIEYFIEHIKREFIEFLAKERNKRSDKIRGIKK